MVQPEKVQELLDDVEKCRSNKLNSGLKLVLEAATREMVPHALQVDNISAMEVNMLRAGVFKVCSLNLCQSLQYSINQLRVRSRQALDHVVAMGDAQITRDRRQEETALRRGAGGRARVRVQQQGSAREPGYDAATASAALAAAEVDEIAALHGDESGGPVDLS